MRVVFIRHGMTAGNLKKRYIGRTDEPLCSESISALRTRTFPQCDAIICSPMKRCLQTAEVIFPHREIVTESELRECDFGDFEGKNYIELSGDAAYQRWVDSGGTLPFPNGENPQKFKERSISAFEKVIEKHGMSTSIAFVVHGGTIMSILEKYAVPSKKFYEWYCENGCGYDCDWDGSKLRITEKL